MRRQRAAHRLRADEGANGCLLRRRIGCRFSFGGGRLQFLELHLQLIEQLTATLGGGAEPVALHLRDQQFEMRDHRLGAGSSGFPLAARLLFHHQSGSEGLDVEGNRFTHAEDSTTNRQCRTEEICSNVDLSGTTRPPLAARFAGDAASQFRQAYSRVARR
jgi:hypothetical protein